jgi:hypothetical protein
LPRLRCCRQQKASEFSHGNLSISVFSEILTLFKSSLNAHYLNSLDDSRSTLPRALKSMSIASERHMSSDSSRRNPRPLPRHERYIYTYRLLANGAPLHFLISCANNRPFMASDSSVFLRSVEPDNGKPRPGKYTFRLSLKTNGIERSLGEPTTRLLRVDPRQLNFVVLYVNNPWPYNYEQPLFCLIPKSISVCSLEKQGCLQDVYGLFVYGCA